MSVVINDFEILVDPPAQHPAEPATQEQMVAPIRPREIERIVLYFQARRLRVSAD